MLFPRLLSVAERAWHEAPWESDPNPIRRRRRKKEDWEVFANAVGYNELRRLSKLGIYYRVPVPGAK